MTTQPAVAVRGLTKTFGDVRALDGLDLTVAPGQVAGFLGPNGAGKSTTLRILLGLLKADGGEARLLGGDPWVDAVALHRRLAYVPGEVTLWPNLTGGEVIDLLHRLRGSSAAGGAAGRRKAELLERFELDPTKKVRTYSKGNRQKVALVAALAAEVELLVLDEPTSGLDPLMEAMFTESLREAKARGQAVLLSSHILAEVEKVCDTVTIIRNGRTVESGTLAELRHLTRNTVTAVTRRDPTRLADLPGVYDPVVDGRRVTFLVDASALDEVTAELSALGLESLVCAPPSLEQLFLQHYGDELAELEGASAR
jgi:ABC-2 type transport system ATP-binding protein